MPRDVVLGVVAAGLVACSVLCCSAVGCGGTARQRSADPPPADTPRGPVQALSAQDLVMAWAEESSRASGDFNESMVSRATLDGGGDVYVRLLVTNVAGADGRAEMKARVNLADGRKLEGRVRMKPGGWLYGEDGFDVRLGDSRMHVVPGRADFIFAGEGFRAELGITTALPAVRPGGGSGDFGSGTWYRTTLPIPCGRLTGQLTVDRPDTADGEPVAPEVIALAGAAYVEHRAGTVAPYVLAQRWLNLLSVDSERCVAMSAFQRTGQLGGRTQGWLYYATQSELSVWLPDAQFTPGDPHRDDGTGYSVPHTVVVQGPGFKGAVKAERLIKRIDDLGGLGKVERFVVERVMKPWTFRYDASFLFKRDGAKALGGSGRYQYQQLN